MNEEFVPACVPKWATSREEYCARYSLHILVYCPASENYQQMQLKTVLHAIWSTKSNYCDSPFSKSIGVGADDAKCVGFWLQKLPHKESPDLEEIWRHISAYFGMKF